MTREEAIEWGITKSFRVWGGHENVDDAADCVDRFLRMGGPPVDADKLDGFAVGLTMLAVEVSEIARKRREGAAGEAEVPT